MSLPLFFSWNEIKHRGKGLTFDDVLLVPNKSEIRSRRQPQLKTKVTKNYMMDIPIISANMDTITEQEMAHAMWQLGGLGILHRFLPIPQQVDQVVKLKNLNIVPIAASIGVNEEDRQRAHQLVQAGVHILTLDIAHGHSVQMIETLKWVKDHYPHVDVIAGNVATPEATYELIQQGADAVKVGIGPGSMCTTRIITGCGMPQLSAIALCAEVARDHKIPIIADGGLRASGDIVKALAAGAQSVMIGSLLAGTLETPGEVKHGRKLYRGMASRSAQVSWRGELPEGMAPEGESTEVPIKGHVRHVILELTGGIRSGMSYLNAETIEEIPQKARFIEMTFNGYNESKAHGLQMR
ncbi:MAG: guanosine monophosphate reductase [Bdellovibrionaceae bacterium]|nr:guanosine monophosphate reductase [Pseudobdellovibrionaceae bacterium]MDW8189685.1 guanosine monophosphate reductase [Pseudobdellovibrionaceae bacterium]